MKRRSFIQTLAAVPVIAALSKIIPANPEPPPPITDELFHKQPPLTARMSKRESFLQRRALAGIRKGQLLRNHQFENGVIPYDDEPMGGWFAGVAMHDAMADDFVKVMTEGCASVRFK